MSIPNGEKVKPFLQVLPFGSFIPTHPPSVCSILLGFSHGYIPFLSKPNFSPRPRISLPQTYITRLPHQGDALETQSTPTPIALLSNPLFSLRPIVLPAPPLPAMPHPSTSPGRPHAAAVHRQVTCFSRPPRFLTWLPLSPPAPATTPTHL